MNIKKQSAILFFILVIISFPLTARSNKHKLVNKTVYITVEHIASKDRPSFWGGESNTFYYGDELKAVDSDGNWLKVENKKNGKTGWVKDSVLTTRKIKSKGMASVNAQELALAGKGFGNNVEAEKDNVKEFENSFGYAIETIKNRIGSSGESDGGENTQLQLPPDIYADEVESITVSDNELKEFIIEGKLRGDQ